MLYLIAYHTMKKYAVYTVHAGEGIHPPFPLTKYSSERYILLKNAPQKDICLYWLYKIHKTALFRVVFCSHFASQNKKNLE